jgi:hypothetical protein
MRETILMALRFELRWYQSRQQIYLDLAREDAGRMKKIEALLNG